MSWSKEIKFIFFRKIGRRSNIYLRTLKDVKSNSNTFFYPKKIKLLYKQFLNKLYIRIWIIFTVFFSSTNMRVEIWTFGLQKKELKQRSRCFNELCLRHIYLRLELFRLWNRYLILWKWKKDNVVVYVFIKYELSLLTSAISLSSLGPTSPWPSAKFSETALRRTAAPTSAVICRMLQFCIKIFWSLIHELTSLNNEAIRLSWLNFGNMIEQIKLWILPINWWVQNTTLNFFICHIRSKAA